MPKRLDSISAQPKKAKTASTAAPEKDVTPTPDVAAAPKESMPESTSAEKTDATPIDVKPEASTYQEPVKVPAGDVLSNSEPEKAEAVPSEIKSDEKVVETPSETTDEKPATPADAATEAPKPEMASATPAESTPTPEPSPSPEAVPTPDPVISAEPVPTPEPTPTSEATPTLTPTPSADAVPQPTGIPTPTNTDQTKSTSDTFENLFPEPSIVMSGPPGWLWWILLVIGAAGLGFLAFDMTRGKIDTWLSISPSPSSSVSATASPSPSSSESTATPTPTPTPTPSPSGVNKAAITMRVLNGTSQSGAAATVKSTLEKAGFTVRTTGNAKTTNYTATMIYYQTGHLADAQAVASGLAPTKTTLTESTLANPDMILVVVGTNK